MSELKGPAGELRATIHVTRKATGKVDTFTLSAETTPEQHAAIMKEIEKGKADGGDALDGK